MLRAGPGLLTAVEASQSLALSVHFVVLQMTSQVSFGTSLHRDFWAPGGAVTWAAVARVKERQERAGVGAAGSSCCQLSCSSCLKDFDEVPPSLSPPSLLILISISSLPAASPRTQKSNLMTLP